MKKKKGKYKEKPDHSYSKNEIGNQIHTNDKKDMEAEETLRIIIEQQNSNKFKKPKKKSCQPPLLVPINEDHESQPLPPPVMPQLVIETIPQQISSYSPNLLPQNLYDPLPEIVYEPLPPPTLEIPQNPIEQLFLNKFGQFCENNPIEDHEYAEPADLIEDTMKIGELEEPSEHQIQQNNDFHNYIPMEPWTEKQNEYDRLISGTHQKAQGTPSQMINETNQELFNNSDILEPLWENAQENNSITTDYIQNKDLEIYQEQNEQHMDNNNTDQTLPTSIDGLLQEEHSDNGQGEINKEQQNQNPQEKEQWEKIEITTNIRKLRKILNMKLPTWYTIIMLMSESAVKINAMENNTSYGVDINQTILPLDIHPDWDPIKRDTFRPIENIPHPGPLFTTTQEEAMVEIQKGNFSIQLETYYKNPYIKTTIEIPTETYEEYVQVIDIKDLSVENWNAIRFLTKENDKQYQDHMKFKAITNEEKFFDTSKDKYEYYQYPKKLGFQDCNLACPLLEAQMPETPVQLQEAGKLFNLTSEYMWVNTQQTATIRESWTWKQKYNYKVFFHNKQIYPEAESGFTPATGITVPQECKVYKNKIKTNHEEIGYQYDYWKDDTYHVTSAYRLQTALNKNWECRIVVMNEDHEITHNLDDNTCICARKRQSNFENKMDAEMSNLQNNMLKQMNHTVIEEWRFLTTTNYSSLANVENQIIPRNTKINKENLNQMKKRYLNTKDLTELKLEQTKSRTLRHKDMAKKLGKKLLKTILSHPDQLINFHNMVRNNIGKISSGTKISFLDTNYIYGNAQEFADKMNKLFPSFAVTQNNNKITVRSSLEKYKEWNDLENIDSAATIVNGLMKSRRIKTNYDIFQETMLHKIMAHVKVPMHDNHKKKTAYDRLTIVTAKEHSSYVELRIFVPILLEDVTRMIRTYSLPHQIHEETGKYISKKVPAAILLNPGKEKPSTNRCGIDILQNKGELKHCQNTITTLEDINKLTDLGDFSIFMLRPLGKTTINCPQQKLQFLNFDQDISVIIVHHSCYVNTEHLHIDPISMTSPMEPGILSLLSYNLHQKDWFIPPTAHRWYLQLATILISILPLLIVITCIIWIWKKKTQATRLALVKTTRDEIMKRRINKTTENQSENHKAVCCTTTDELADKNRHSYIPYHLNDMYVEPKIEDNVILRNLEGPELEYIRDYTKDHKDISSGIEEKIDQVTDHYATIKPKKKKNTQSQETLNSIKDANTNQETTKDKAIIPEQTAFVERVTKKLQDQIEIPKKQPVGKGEIAGWKFDKNPLHTHEMK